MFTGIVQEVATVKRVHNRDGLRTIALTLTPLFCTGLVLGASVAVDGVCLTVSHIDPHQVVSFDMMLETLQTTTLSQVQEGSLVNVERAAKEGAEVGGHLLSGHIDCCGKIIDIQKPPHNWMLRIEVAAKWMRYIFNKGFLAINGTSLTVTNVDAAKNTFDVWLIPETLRQTTFSEKNVGSLVNLEVERSTQVIVDTLYTAVHEAVRSLLVERLK